MGKGKPSITEKGRNKTGAEESWQIPTIPGNFCETVWTKFISLFFHDLEADMTTVM